MGTWWPWARVGGRRGRKANGERRRVAIIVVGRSGLVVGDGFLEGGE